MKKTLKKIMQFTAVFEEDEDVGGYTVSIPELPGCFSEGDTFEKAMENIQEAAELYLEPFPGLKRAQYQEKRVILAAITVAA